MCLLPFLIPYHQPPLRSFYPEWLAAGAGPDCIWCGAGEPSFSVDHIAGYGALDDRLRSVSGRVRRRARYGLSADVALGRCLRALCRADDLARRLRDNRDQPGQDRGRAGGMHSGRGARQRGGRGRAVLRPRRLAGRPDRRSARHPRLRQYCAAEPLRQLPRARRGGSVVPVGSRTRRRGCNRVCRGAARLGHRPVGFPGCAALCPVVCRAWCILGAWVARRRDAPALRRSPSVVGGHVGRLYRRALAQRPVWLGADRRSGRRAHVEHLRRPPLAGVGARPADFCRCADHGRGHRGVRGRCIRGRFASRNDGQVRGLDLTSQPGPAAVGRDRRRGDHPRAHRRRRMVLAGLAPATALRCSLPRGG